MENQTDETLLGGVAPTFVVDVTATGTSYRSASAVHSIDEVLVAFRAAATYTSSLAGIVIAIIVATLIALATWRWLLIVVAIAGIALLLQASARAARRRRVPIAYHLDEGTLRVFESLANGVGWLAGSQALWRITHEELIQRPANTTSVTRVSANASRGGVENVLTNIAVPSIAADGQTLLFFPDALIVRDNAANFAGVAYTSIRVECETMRFSESHAAPGDSKQVGQSWRYANKDGSPDRRRRDNRAIPLLEYGRVVLTWRDAGCVLLASNVEAARQFANAVQTMVQFRSPAGQPRAITEKIMTTSSPRMPTPPNDLERVLQASIDRKQRLEELKRNAAAVTARAEATQRSVTEPVIDANAYWIAKGGSANVQGFATGDFVYVGKGIPSFDGSGIEPSAIDPMQPIDPGRVDTVNDGIGHWPSFSSMYLEWLAGGRNDPHVNLGLLFIFFYGVERRVYEFIHGRGSNGDEVLAIAYEISRLLELHATRSKSFASHGEALLYLIASIEPRARTIPGHEPVRPGDGVPMRLAIALGEATLAGKPVPAHLAYDWMRATQYLNTPATRCEREFELLFHIRYAEQFGEGLAIQPNKTFIDLTYRPASPALDALIFKQRNIPDVTQLARPVGKLAGLAQQCCSALDPFSRFLGKNPDARESLAAFALLPDELVEGTHSADAKALAALVVSRLDANGRAHLAAGELLQYVRIAKPEKVSKNEAMLLAQSLEKLGYGIEPDVRLGGPAFELDGGVVVFRRLPDCPSTASDDYATATLCMRLGTVVSAADDDVSDLERALLERQIADTLQLSPGERQRLGAHLAWLVETKPGTGGLKKRLDSLSHDARQHIGKLLVSIATTDGHVDPREMKILEKLYDLIGLDASDLYRDVHAAHAGDDEPIVVGQASLAPKGFAIPPKPAPTTKAPSLDMSRVRLKIAETRQVSALLGSIFAEEEAPVAVTPAIAQVGTIGTLDAAHSELLRRLAERESWPREGVERLAADLALLLDGALETINDYAYATADQPFWEDDDPLAINAKVAMELIR